MTMLGFGKSRFERESRRVRPHLLSYALTLLPTSDDAEDAVQETLLKLWGVRHRIADEPHLRNLARCIVRQVCVNMLRSMAVRQTEPLSDELEIPSTDTPLLRLEHRELMVRAQSVWQALPQQHRIILHMKETEGLSLEEIAQLLGTTNGNVRTRLSRARKEMLTRLGES